jgi:pilus assembly protein Flp/PilA
MRGVYKRISVLIKKLINDLLRAEKGATAVEYALMATLIAVAIVGAVTIFGNAVVALFNSVPPEL